MRRRIGVAALAQFVAEHARNAGPRCTTFTSHARPPPLRAGRPLPGASPSPEVTADPEAGWSRSAYLRQSLTDRALHAVTLRLMGKRFHRSSRHRDGTFAGGGGLPLYYQAWIPQVGRPKGGPGQPARPGRPQWAVPHLADALPRQGHRALRL